ncbi:hypothetical protein ACOTHJ_12875 [Achromobacter xylosoxidans]|uniref:hypothetical protein n=1 Tax=Achromobacter anxifer TaxID=1287737 RepID=UPI00159063B3|nr:hypothetical protein [Achromobacter anxifer]
MTTPDLKFPEVQLPIASALAAPAGLGPIYGFTQQQLLAFRDQILEAAAKVCDQEYQAHLPLSADNRPGHRESDFAFGSVNTAERLAAVFREQCRKPQAPASEDLNAEQQSSKELHEWRQGLKRGEGARGLTFPGR